MSDDGEVGTKKFLLGFALVIVMGAFIGVSRATDIDLRFMVFGWVVVIAVFVVFGRWKREK